MARDVLVRTHRGDFIFDSGQRVVSCRVGQPPIVVVARRRGVSKVYRGSEHVIVVGVTGERIGTVERLEIDKTGRLKALIVQIASAFGSRKRIQAESIRAINGGVVEVAMTPTDVSKLVDEQEQPPADLWAIEEPLRANA